MFITGSDLLDGKMINIVTRKFVEKFEANRSQMELIASKTSQNAAAASAEGNFNKFKIIS